MRFVWLGMFLALRAPEKLWQLDLKSASYGSAAVGDLDGDGKPEIVFGTYTNDEHLYAVGAKDGSVLWKFKSHGGPFDASVAIVKLEDQTVVLAADSGDGTLFCLDAKGRELWTVKLPSGTDSPPAVADLDGDGTPEIVVGTMMAADRKGRVCAISNKKIIWEAKVPGHVQSEPALVDLDGDHKLEVVVTCWMGDKKVRALSGKDGSELWSFQADGEMYHGVSIAGESIVFATCAGTVYALDFKGALRWKTTLQGEYLFAPTTVVGKDIVVGGRSLYVLDENGKERWRRKGGSVDRGAAVADVDGDGKPDLVVGMGCLLLALDEATGNELWSFDARSGENVYESIGSAPVLADFDGDGKLDVFFVCGKGTSDKTRKDNYGRAYALRAGDGKGPGWPTFRGSLRRTGSLN